LDQAIRKCCVDQLSWHNFSRLNADRSLVQGAAVEADQAQIFPFGNSEVTFNEQRAALHQEARVF